ncbi:hypothetical protein GN958_ATG05766 [Phytophthora infestans]|uniref:Uncharacterized protein n=1 Tax=Phytophthora infestans TaxID=4787 RepID=A0A8S9V1G9_PHYIN|nr:hypothetical protein GN958_ATG05766 [Phytophthora infestans]
MDKNAVPVESFAGNWEAVTTKHRRLGGLLRGGEVSNRKVSDVEYARQLERTARETYAQRLTDAGHPLAAMTCKALEKQREVQKQEL